MALPLAAGAINVRVTIDDSRIPEALALMPLETAVQIRNALGRAFGKWYATHVASVGPRMANMAKRIRYKVRPGNLTRKQTKTLPKEKAIDETYTRTRAYLQNVIREGGDALAKVWGSILSSSPAVGIQERGGTVRPTKGEFLTIPFQWPRSPIGGDYTGKKQVAQLRERFKPFRIGQMLYYRFGTEIVPAFVLKREVTIRPGLRVMATWNSLEGYRTQVFREAIDAVFAKFNREARSTISRAAKFAAMVG